jgi:hypothetical protein
MAEDNLSLVTDPNGEFANVVFGDEELHAIVVSQGEFSSVTVVFKLVDFHLDRIDSLSNCIQLMLDFIRNSDSAEQKFVGVMTEVVNLLGEFGEELFIPFFQCEFLCHGYVS